MHNPENKSEKERKKKSLKKSERKKKRRARHGDRKMKRATVSQLLGAIVSDEIKIVEANIRKRKKNIRLIYGEKRKVNITVTKIELLKQVHSGPPPD